MLCVLPIGMSPPKKKSFSLSLSLILSFFFFVAFVCLHDNDAAEVDRMAALLQHILAGQRRSFMSALLRTRHEAMTYACRFLLLFSCFAFRLSFTLPMPSRPVLCECASLTLTSASSLRPAAVVDMCTGALVPSLSRSVLA